MNASLIQLKSGNTQGEWITNSDTRELEAELRRHVVGEVRFDPGTRGVYAVDGGNYRQVPIGAVIPRTIEDVIETVKVCRDFGAPVLSRGGGTSLAGQCCNVALVMDWTKYLHNVLEINTGEKWARVQPGTICDDLRNAAGEHAQLTFAPDPATHNHCTLGGMIGNNSCGVHAQMAGKTVDQVEELDILLYDGHRMKAGWMTPDELDAAIRTGGRTGKIFDQIKSLRDRYASLINDRYPHIPRRVSGYNLDQLLPGKDGRFNLGRALVGSEGTLITILEAKLRLHYNPPYHTLLVLGYPDIYEAADAVPKILEKSKPIGFEAIDNLLVENIKKKHLHEEYLKKLPQGKGWLLVQFGGETKKDADDQARELMDALRGTKAQPKLYDDVEDEKAVWKVRESGLGATAFVPGQPVTWEGWEDSALAPENLGAYLRDLCKLYEKYDYFGALYGHFGMGCVHTRINFDLMSTGGIRKFRSFIDEASDLVVRHGGSLSGEHGDGQSKAEFLYKMFGPEIIRGFEEFKAIWDPQNKMNPHKVVDPYKIDQNLRLGADYNPWRPKTHFQFPDDRGDFSHAALRCVGVGKCRRTEADEIANDTMCPSYMATLEEKHSTRGRAHLLWEMLNDFPQDGSTRGGPIKNGWKDEAVKEALDLCLSCKGCKSDCPVNVDMATYKAEFLSHFYEGRVRPRHAYAFGLVDKWAELASIVPGLVNLATSTPLLRDIAKAAAGMPAQRQVPQFAPRTFKSWWKRRGVRNEGAPRVILWADTFNNHFFPETMQAGVEVLEAAGFQVHVPMQHLCCGRPLYDYGMLETAKQYLLKILKTLAPQIAAGVPMVVLEPSCAAVFRDEMTNLFPSRNDAHKLRENTFVLSEFLAKKAPSFALPKLHRKALLHGHCHHKAIMKIDDEKSLLQKMELDSEPVAAGCCGMAGSFGFEEDKYEVSVAVGERVLLPKVREADPSTLIVADGFSCREQISQLTNRHALHFAEVLQMALREGPAGPSGDQPEQQMVERRQAGLRRSKARAVAGLGAASVAAAGLLWLLRRD
jgi:FAD/FMN-containing dehydrogenase/Fe-S oxidoreductase